MPIERGKPVDIDFEHTEDSKTYCQHCLKVNVYSLLKPRLYEKGEMPLSDDENWLQCYRCGKVTERYNLRYDNNRLVPFSEPSDDPFDFGQSSIQIVKGRNLEEEANKRFDDDFDYIKDDNLKNELRKGNILLSYSETDNPDIEYV
jgi:hypothetical protein